MADSKPGFSAIKETEEYQIWAAGPDNQHKRFLIKADIKSSVTDSGNTPTTTLRGGFTLGLKDSDGLCYKYAADQTDGTQKVVGVLSKSLSMLDKDGTVEDKMTRILTQGIFKNPTVDLINFDKHVLAVLARIGFTNASLEPHGSWFGLHFKSRYFKTTDYTLQDSDHGCMFVATGAATFTLPTLATVGKGYQVMLFQATNNNLVVTGASNSIVYDNTSNSQATTLTWSTSSQKMGASVLMTVDYAATSGSLAWFPTMIQRTVVAS
jgi:hypothetical protein